LREIKDAARAQLAEVGAASLSVRAVTRQLGMTPSAVYRYFPNRDALLTALITDAYVALGESAAAAEQVVARDHYFGRWSALHRAVREWALAHPHEYALIYGSPVPGYVAPEDTAAPAARVPLLLASVAVEAGAGGAPEGATLPEALRADAQRLLDLALAGSAHEEGATVASPDPGVALAVVDAWTELFGCVSFELFGHYRGVISARTQHLDAVARRTAATVGIPTPEPGDDHGAARPE
jgi:AcrR family transcriptional regulator